MYGQDMRQLAQAFDIAHKVRNGTREAKNAARNVYGSLDVRVIVQAIMEAFYGRSRRIDFQYVNTETNTYRVKIGSMTYGIIGRLHPTKTISHLVKIYT